MTERALYAVQAKSLSATAAALTKSLPVISYACQCGLLASARPRRPTTRVRMTLTEKLYGHFCCHEYRRAGVRASISLETPVFSETRNFLVLSRKSEHSVRPFRKKRSRRRRKETLQTADADKPPPVRLYPT